MPPSALLENSKAALMLSGLIPNDGTEEEALKRRLLHRPVLRVADALLPGQGRLRWLDQCVEFAEPHCRTWQETRCRRKASPDCLTANPPDNVRQKLTGWGVADYVSIFSRAIGLNAVFAEPPALTSLCEDFCAAITATRTTFFTAVWRRNRTAR